MTESELKMTSQRIGYGRVSTADQDLDAQRDALAKAGVDLIFVEKIKQADPSLTSLCRSFGRTMF
jgi:DNA invertase Pin-like site-specific DNA recombinase